MGVDELWPGGPRFLTEKGVFPLSTDSVLLAHFAAGIRGKRILDLGCGAGILPVLLHISHPAAQLWGIELQEAAAELCRKNLERNGCDAAGILTGDLRAHRRMLPAGGFDLLVSNPPFFPEGHGYASPDPARAAARDERKCTLDELCAAAAYLCRWGGAFALVYRPERLSVLCCALSAHGLEPKRLRMVQHRAERPPSLVLLEARRGGKPGLEIQAPLLLCAGDGSDSEELREIYHRQGPGQSADRLLDTATDGKVGIP